MDSNTLRYLSLALLVCVAAKVAAIPVIELGSGSSSSFEHLERMLEVRNQMQIDMQRQLAQMAGELDELHGGVEKNRHELKQIVERQRELYREIDTLRNAGPVSSVELKTEQLNSSEVYSNNQSENRAYDTAVKLILKEKNYMGATDAFNTFLTEYPESVYMPNAHYWLGQLYFINNSLNLAKRHFNAVSTFAKSSKRADALLKLGMIAQKQGDSVAANTLFQRVINEYVGTTTANQAEKKLKK
ncbi:tol-pal system protein YbgF [Candidatus Enterovibrio escicola]|uniref:Cell division coordinator CpoB n=1 Tax=Candidatus Enterovibrio escicola TaxID=1927127 RepID=A0A2A5T099_9GAMM|nr:tol-pal system protein YbgF [Candidatus Enterovibrio escacola]PCS21597.1 TPR repeat containing exported protein [Candidatus Enterovibrio escacola]